MHQEITKKLTNSQKTYLVYRGSSTILAAALFIFGGILCAVQFKNVDFKEVLKLNQTTAYTDGIILDAYYTGIRKSIGEDEGYYYINGYTYEYTVNGKPYLWTSYAASNYRIKKIGDKVRIKYNTEDPSYSVINYFDYLPNGTSVLYLLLIPSIGLLLLLFHLGKGIYFLKIIENGVITKGEFTKKDIVLRNDSFEYYKLSFSYFIENTKEKLYVSVITSSTEKFERSKKGYVIYNKRNPKRALLVDDLAAPISKYIKQNWTK